MMMTMTRCAMRVRKRAGTRLLTTDIELNRKQYHVRLNCANEHSTKALASCKLAVYTKDVTLTADERTSFLKGAANIVQLACSK